MHPDREKILLVEDDTHDIELILHAMKNYDLAQFVHVVQDGATALEYLFQSPPSRKPDLIILDLKLCKMDGIQILHQIRQHPETANIHVILFTSSEEIGDVHRGREFMVDGYFVKPVIYEEFTKVIDQIVFYWDMIKGTK